MAGGATDGRRLAGAVCHGVGRACRLQHRTAGTAAPVQPPRLLASKRSALVVGEASAQPVQRVEPQLARIAVGTEQLSLAVHGAVRHHGGQRQLVVVKQLQPPEPTALPAGQLSRSPAG